MSSKNDKSGPSAAAASEAGAAALGRMAKELNLGVLDRYVLAAMADATADDGRAEKQAARNVIGRCRDRLCDDCFRVLAGEVE